MKPTTAIGTAALLIILLAAELFISEKYTSMTWDEPQHIAAGYSKIMTGDFRMNTEHPPLMHFLEGLPLLILKPKLTLDESWNNKNMMEFTRKFFFVNNKNPRELLTYGRIPIILLTISLGTIVFLWTKKLFGINAALIALTLYTFEPNVLAHGILATTDMGFAFFGTLALYFYWNFFQKPTTNNLILAAITMGLAQLTKYTAIFLWPIYFIIILTTTPKQKIRFHLKSLLFIIVISTLIINTAYLFQGSFIPIKDSMLADKTLDKSFTRILDDKAINFIAEKIPSPLPYYYIKGLGFVTYEGARNNATTIFGIQYPQGVWWYYILAFTAKTTLPFIILTIISLLLIKKHHQHWQFTLLPAATIFIVLSLMTKQAGIRYILAIFPLLTIWVAGQISHRNILKNNMFTTGILLIITLHAASTTAQFPNYLSYYNEFVMAENGWKYFTDSNTDWGQDFDKLKRYVSCRPDTKIAYFGTQDLAFYGLDKKEADENCNKELLAISATNTADNKFSWLKKYEPTGKIGNSILLYNITDCTIKNG